MAASVRLLATLRETFQAACGARRSGDLAKAVIVLNSLRMLSVSTHIKLLKA
jgi:hypothetical protein